MDLEEELKEYESDFEKAEVVGMKLEWINCWFLKIKL
jgi:hypothetical protein